LAWHANRLVNFNGRERPLTRAPASGCDASRRYEVPYSVSTRPSMEANMRGIPAACSDLRAILGTSKTNGLSRGKPLLWSSAPPLQTASARGTLFAWLRWKRRLLVRWEYYESNFLSFRSTRQHHDPSKAILRWVLVCLDHHAQSPSACVSDKTKEATTVISATASTSMNDATRPRSVAAKAAPDNARQPRH
jgi:hypothetical protein